MAQQNSSQNSWANATFTTSYKAPTQLQPALAAPPPAFSSFGTNSFPSMSGLPTTPLFGNTQTQVTPLFGNTQIPNTTTQTNQTNQTNQSAQLNQATPVFGTQQTTNTSTQQTADKNQNQGQVLQCLIETKAINTEILTELKSIVMKLNNNAQAAQKTVHTGIFCNSCGKQNITGVRYKCMICKEYDLCEECEVKPTQQNHDQMHVFVKIKDTSSYNHVVSVMREKNINYFSL